MRFIFHLLQLGTGGTLAWAHLTITPIFDSTITADPNGAAIQNAIYLAIGKYHTSFGDPINVTISFAKATSGLGESQTTLYKISYSTFYSALTADAKTTNDSTALAHLPSASASNSPNPVTGSTTINITSANLKALRIPGTFPSALPCGCDGAVFLNTSITNPGSPGSPGSYDLATVVQHEIDEVLGLGSSLNALAAGLGGFFSDPCPEDLFRYATNGARSFTTSSSALAYFSIDSIAQLAQFDNQHDGGDYADWQSNPLPLGVQPEVQDAFLRAGARPALGVELVALDVIGFDLIPPSKVGIFRPSSALLAEDVNGNLAWDPGIDRVIFFGNSGDVQIYGDWDGSGTTKVGIFRPSVGMFALDMNGNGVWDRGIDRFGFFGQTGDIPIVGDWTGDGRTKVGIYRPSTALFALDLNNNLAWDPGIDRTGVYGEPGDTPIIGNWSGDGIYKVGIFRNGLWALDINGNIVWDPGTDTVGVIGQSGDVPLLGDWNGDGRTKVGIYRPTASLFGLDYNGNLVWDAGTDRAGVFGIPTDTPILGDWDGSGITRIGIYRAASGFWALDTNGNIAWDSGTDRSGSFGAPGDTPVVGRW